MNNLLDFAGLLLYYLFLPILLPVKVLLYVLAGVWFAFHFCNRMILATPRLVLRLRRASHNLTPGVYVPLWRKKLVKVSA